MLKKLASFIIVSMIVAVLALVMSVESPDPISEREADLRAERIEIKHGKLKERAGSKYIINN